MNPHYFGSSNSPLFGIHHAPRPHSGSENAVLICPPIGHEHIRTYWGLRLLAQRFARDGFHVMRFDYTGMGDSAGWIGGVESLERWSDDVRLAAENLLAESGCSNLSIVGLRMGASLASLAASQSQLPIERLILWDPVIDGSRYLQSLEAMHEQMLDLWVCPMETDDDQTGAEILGFFYQRRMLDEINRLDMSSLRPSCKQLTVLQTGSDQQCAESKLRSASGEPANWTGVSESPDWDQLGSIESAWLSAAGTSRVLEIAQEPTASSRQQSIDSETGLSGLPVATDGLDSIASSNAGTLY